MKIKQDNLLFKKRIFLIIILVTFGALFYFFAFPTRGLVKVEGYNKYDGNGTICQALSPECGYCPGKVHSGECYVDPNDKTQKRFLN
jgi:hypothetical protein